MVINVACPKCRRPLQFDDQAGGRVAACPCGQQMMLPVAPIAPAPRAANPRPAARSAAAPARRPAGGGGGAGPVVLVILLVLGLVAGIVMFKRSQSMHEFDRLTAEQNARKEEQAKAGAEDKRYVLLRVWIDEAVLPPDKRNVAEGATQYLGVRVEVVNHGYDPVTVDPVYFTLTADGARYGRDAADAAPKFEPVLLKDGEKVTVPLAFAVPDAKKPVVVDFKPAKPEKCNLRYGDAR
ncbi:MAG: DUF4352 domain-containing protein [Planctomycetes bacterium]|nr:DUF4352 domain-containing protein [Planctomycetota bacterium]